MGCCRDRETAAKLSTAVLGTIVRTVRERRGMTRKELGKAVGRSERWVYRVEAGHQRLSVEGLFEVAAGLGTPASVLFGGCCRALGG